MTDQTRLTDRGLDDLVPESHDILDRVQDEHDASHAFALFSGGHDSLATHLAMDWGATAVVHINTGIGIPDTREFVRTTCDEHDWPLIEYHASEHDSGKTFEEYVEEYGMPGPAHHQIVYSYLKERSIRKLVREHKTGHGDRILLITGVRKMESTRRMGHVNEQNREGAKVYTAPILEWTGTDCRRYIGRHDLDPNPVVDLLEMSGECLCGAMARDRETNEKEQIRTWYPEVAERIDELEQKAKENGNPWRWGRRHQDELYPDEADTELPLCVDCEARDP